MELLVIVVVAQFPVCGALWLIGGVVTLIPRMIGMLLRM
jgi:hypothetical protein